MRKLVIEIAMIRCKIKDIIYFRHKGYIIYFCYCRDNVVCYDSGKGKLTLPSEKTS